MKPTRFRALPLFLLAIALTACSKNPPTTPSNVLSVAGAYATRVTLIAERNTCGAVTVQDFPTTVTHTPGATSLTLVHAGSTYSGTIDNAGKFVTPPANFIFPEALYTIGITGQFTTTGFTATVALTRQQSGATCTYEVAWVGTKQGSPNTIPG